MHTKGQANLKMATRYFKLFVNRLAYTVQSPRPGVNGKHYYYRPNDNRRLTLETIREHLNGHLTVGPLCRTQPGDTALEVGGNRRRLRECTRRPAQAAMGVAPGRR